MEQIRDYQEWFDGLLEGQVGKRRKAFFVPDGSKTLFTKEAALKDEFDEWIVRVVCYCFSLPPTAFVRQMNRATAENAKQQAQEEGLEPDKLWFKDVMDDLLARMGQPELEWYSGRRGDHGPADQGDRGRLIVWRRGGHGEADHGARRGAGDDELGPRHA